MLLASSDTQVLPRQCEIKYHNPGCYRAVTRHYLNEDLAYGAPCLTPNCDGGLTSIEHWKDGILEHHILKRKEEPKKGWLVPSAALGA